MGPLDPFN